MPIENIGREQFNFNFEAANEDDLKQIDEIDHCPEEHAKMLKRRKINSCQTWRQNSWVRFRLL